MRTMADDIFAGGVPDGCDLYAGYDDGNWPDADALAARFPGKRIVRVTVRPSDNEGDVLDIETGDAQPSDAPGWLSRRRAAGAWPSLYLSRSALPAVQAAIDGMAEPPYWIADYTNSPHMPAGATACQWVSYPNYDMSIVADYWPGIDPAPGGFLMPVFINDADGDDWFVRKCFNEEMGREPAAAEQTSWVSFKAAKGADLTLAGIRDSQEAQNFRARRGW